MSQPQPYVPAHAFVTDAANLPRFPGQQLDVEFQDIKATTDQVLANLKLIQRDDGALANGVVTYDSLSPSIQTGGLAPANAWVTGTAYTAGVSVVTNGGLYRCLIAHTAGVFATDLAAGKWLFVTALTVGVNGTNGTNGATGPGYGGTSTTSLLIANSTTKTFTTQAGLAYVVGSRIRATSAANVSNFMEGACTGYSGTSLSISVDNIGGSGTHADWMFTLAVALNANATSVQYDTIALAIAAPIPSSATTVLLLGRNAPGDLGGGLYKKLVSAPGTPRSWHWQNTAASSWWQLDTPRVNPRMFGTTGLGVADDRQPLQDSFDYISTLWPGGVVDGVPGDVYRCVINNGVTNLGLVLGTNVNTFGNGATINFECAGEVYGLRPKGKNLISGWTLATTVSSGLASPDQAIIHAPVALGTAYGSSGTVASPDPFVAPSDVEICGNTLTSVRNNGGGDILHGFGGGDNIYIHDNTFPDNATTGIAIGFDWLPISAINEANLAATQTAYLAVPSTAQTFHWTRLRMINNRIGNMTMPATPSAPSSPTFGSHGIRLSGVASYEIRDNDISSTTYAGIFITGCDLAMEFASVAELRYFAFRNCVVSGNKLRNSNYGYSIRVDACPDNIYDAATNPANSQYPYSPLFLITYPTDVVIERNFGNANGSWGVLEGIYLTQMIGGTVRGNVMLFHKNGIRVADVASDVKIVDGSCPAPGCQPRGCC